MSAGIYCYKDSLNNDSIVYIGKDSNIDRHKRHIEHSAPSKYNAQPFNRVLQNNPYRYDYEVICEAEHYSDVYLNCLEKGLIKVYNPKFNYTNGGDGVRGFKHSDENLKRMSESQKGEKGYWYGKHFSESTRRKMSESRKGDKNPNWKDFPRIVKKGFCRGKQRYALRYNGKTIKESVFLEKLELSLEELLN